jgi:hypothetical protein
VLSFQKRANPDPQPFPLSSDDILIAAFWKDRVPPEIPPRVVETVFYRFSDDQIFLNKIGSFIDGFSPSLLLICTWKSPNIVEFSCLVS